MSLSYFFQLTMAGLSVGMVYALVGMGLMLLIRAAGLMNFAQGNLLAMGAYVGFVLMNRVNISSGILQVLIGFFFFVMVGCLFCAICFFPFKHTKWPQAMLICTIGAGTVINQLCLMLVSTQNLKMQPIIKGSLKIGSFVLQYQYLVVLVVSSLLIGGVYLLFDKLYCGRVMSAAAQNKYAADLIGIPTNLTTMITFAIVVVIVGFSGWLIAPIFMVRSTLSNFQMKAFAGMVIGGWGNLKGAVVGGIIIGLVESYSVAITVAYRDVIVFGFLLVMLLVRPTGLFKGVGWREKA